MKHVRLQAARTTSPTALPRRGHFCACPTAASFSEATDVGEFCGKNLVRLSCFMQGGGFGEGRMPHGEVERDLEGGMRWGATWKEGLLSSQRYELGRVQSHGCAQLKLILLAVGGG